MWREIKDKAKIQLLRVLNNTKFLRASFDISNDESELTEHALEHKIVGQPISDTVLIRWRYIVDLFVENGFI